MDITAGILYLASIDVHGSVDPFFTTCAGRRPRRSCEEPGKRSTGPSPIGSEQFLHTAKHLRCLPAIRIDTSTIEITRH